MSNLPFVLTVLGWKKAEVYSVEDTDVSLIFGAIRGAAKGRYIFNVEYQSNEANATLMNPQLLSRVDYMARDVNVGLRLPKYSSSDRSTAKSTTLQMILQQPVSLGEAQFLHPHQVTLHVIGECLICISLLPCSPQCIHTLIYDVGIHLCSQLYILLVLVNNHSRSVDIS